MPSAAPIRGWLRSAAAAVPLLLALLAIPPPASLALPPSAHTSLTPETARPHTPVLEGIVTGVAGAEAQAEFSAAEGAWAGGRRTLLHGKRRPRSYTVCPLCTPVTCNTATKVCSGHCKSSRTLFTCKTGSRVKPGCGEAEDEKPDPATVSPDSITGLASAWVMVTAPYVGCANVSNAADGCPDAGTTGTLNGDGVTVLASSCTQHLYKLPCARTDPPSPFYPFGFCMCLLKFDSGRVGRGPCRMSYLDWSGPAGGEDAVPVRVALDGAVTRTTFSETDEADDVADTLKHTFSSQEGPIDAELRIFSSVTEEGFDIVAEGPLPEEEGAVFKEEAEEDESAVGKFLRTFTPK